METAAGHGLGTKAIALTQDHGKDRHGQAGGGYKHATDMAHLGGLFDIGPDHKAGRIAKRQDGQAIGLA